MADANKVAVLRAAEQALEQKNFPEVVRCCKQVLKQDRASYGAYVLLAKALQGTNHFPQAQVALRKAVETDKSGLPAWMALMDLHEADGDFDKFLEACNTVKQITLASGDMKNYASCVERLAFTYVKAARHEEALAAWKELLKVENVLTPDMQLKGRCGVIDAQAALLDLAMQQEREKNAGVDVNVKSLRKDLEANLQVALQQPGLHVERYNALLLDLLLRTAGESRGTESQLRLLRQALATTFSSNVATAFEVALIFCEEDDADFLFRSVDTAEDMNKGASYYRFRLGLRFAHLYPSHGLALATIASLSHSSANRKKILCEKALRVDDTCVIGWQLLADLQIAEGAYSGAAESVKRGFQALELWRSKYGLQLFAKELHLQLVQGHMHLAMKNYGDAERLYQLVLEGAHKSAGREARELTSAALEGRAKVAIAQDLLKETEDRLNALLSFDNKNHWALSEQGWLVFNKGDIDGAVRLLEQAVEVCGDNSTYRHRLGLMYWETGERSGKERAVAQLVEAARLDPREAGVFRYLGHYYNQIAGDLRRAARSYQKAITLDPEDAEAGEALCNLLEQGGQIVLEGSICREASQHSPRAYWALRRLGFIQVQAKQWSESVANLQHALRGYSSDGSLWEALGLAYQQLGMLTAALKAYERVVALGNISPIFALLQSGIILQSLASYTEAIDMFRNALEKVPGHVVAQCGLAAALLGRARQCTGVGALSWAATLLQEAADVAHQCTANNGTVAAGWKLLGDIEVAYAQILPCDAMESTLDAVSNGNFSPQVTASFQEKVVCWHRLRKAASKRAQRAYLHLLHVCPQQGSVYGDLAMAMKLDLSLDRNIPGPTSARLDPEKTVLSGLRLDATDADLWFIFGVLAQHKALKQHAFIQALRLDAYHSNTWAHLGQLYLQERELDLAKQAFDRSRSADPTLNLPWAGMAFLHSLSDGKKELDEAFASCLYSVHLSPVMQVQLGLARLAERTHHLHSAQVYAAIEQCVQRAPQSVEALNLKGLVCESRGSFSAAIAAFQLARCIMEQGSGKMDFTASEQRNIILLNLARVLCKAGRAGDAVQVYEMLVESGTLLGEPEAMLSYAVAAWLGNKRELAAAIAKQAVELSREPAGLVLYFKMMYWLSGPLQVLEEIRRAGMDLFRNAIFSGTALAMAVAADHQQSVAGVLYRCNILFDHEKGPQAHQLVAAWKQGKQEEGHRYSSTAEGLLKALHSFPDSFSIRVKLGQELTGSTYGNCANLALRCCNVTVPIATSQEPVCTSLVAAVMADAADATHSVLPKLVRWVHTEPWNKTARSSLVLTLQQMQKPNVSLAVSHLAPTLPASDPKSTDMDILLKLCASSAVLEHGDTATALQHAKAACVLNGSPECNFVASFQLARCYLATQNFPLLRVEVRKCRQILKPDDVLGHFKMSEMEYKLEMQKEVQNSSFERAIGLKFAAASKVWTSLLHLSKAQGLLQMGDYISAEKAAGQACAVHPESAPLHLFHGAICLALSNLGGYTEHLSSAVRSLNKAAQGGPSEISVAGVLLAQAEIIKSNTRSRNAQKWEQILRLSWKSWSEEDRPGELYYQMGLLAEQFKDTSHAGARAPESLQSKRSWMQRAVHVNPACFRYWAVLQ